MTTRSYEQPDCPLAQALRVVGDQWTLMIVRDALGGVRRFEGFQKSLGLSRNLLTQRLRQLEEENRKLKQIVADLSLDKAMLQHVVAKKL